MQVIIITHQGIVYPEKKTAPTGPRKIYEIAAEIRMTWDSVNYGAKPYLEAMECLTDKTSMYVADSATSVVLYFLANATTWRGEDARRIKKELKSIVGVK